MESKGAIKITGSSKLFTLALVCCSFMCADDILQQYVYSTIQYNTILSKGVFFTEKRLLLLCHLHIILVYFDAKFRV